MQEIPDWLGGPLVAAMIAATGYVGKLVHSAWDEARTRHRENKSRLYELYSLLGASKVAFDNQREISRRLYESLKARDPSLVTGNKGYEKWFSCCHASMTDEERELHQIIRAYTVHTIYPLNQAAIDWLRDDKYYKSSTLKLENGKTLGERLSVLEGHLLLWVAKYEMWIPDEDHHALVYLADENRHGLGFPTGIEAEIRKILDSKHWLFG